MPDVQRHDAVVGRHRLPTEPRLGTVQASPEDQHNPVAIGLNCGQHRLRYWVAAIDADSDAGRHTTRCDPRRHPQMVPTQITKRRVLSTVAGRWAVSCPADPRLHPPEGGSPPSDWEMNAPASKVSKLDRLANGPSLRRTVARKPAVGCQSPAVPSAAIGACVSSWLDCNGSRWQVTVASNTP